VDPGRDAAHGVLEGEVQLGLEVLAPVGPGAPAASTLALAPEEVAEQVAEVAAVLEREAAEPARPAAAREPGARRPEPPHLVVLLAPLGVADHVVGGRHLLEALLGGGVAGVGVGVVLARQLPERALDVLGAGRVRHAEDPVVVLLEPLALGSHRRSLPASRSP
jgi:hypothetical protein